MEKKKKERHHCCVRLPQVWLLGLFLYATFGIIIGKKNPYNSLSISLWMFVKENGQQT
jgi:hypothetical protein